jgi:prevent-host-death family protein
MMWLQWDMETGIREAKNNLSKLVQAVLDGEEVFLTNRGERVVQLVAAPKPKSANRGRGLWKGKLNLYPGWDSPEEDKKIEDMFEVLREDHP